MANVMIDLSGVRFGKLTAILSTGELQRGYVVGGAGAIVEISFSFLRSVYVMALRRPAGA